MLVTQKPKYYVTKMSPHLKPTTRCQQIPVKCVSTVKDLVTLRKMGFLGWRCYAHYGAKLLQAQLLGMRRHNIKRVANMSVL